MHMLKITAIGNSVGVILPKEILARLQVGKGDMLSVVDTPDGVRLTLISKLKWQRRAKS